MAVCDEVLTYDRVTAARLGLTPQSLDSDALQRLRPAAGLGHLHPAQPVLRGAGGRSAVLADPGRAEVHLSSAAAANGVTPLRAVATAQASTTPLQVNHTGLFPSVTVSFNLAPGLSLERRHAARSARCRPSSALPSTIRGFFAGTLQAYQQSLSTEPILITHGPAGGLHRAGHSVREPGASADHHLHAAFGQRRRHAGAAAVQERSQRHLHHRHRAARSAS